MHWKDYLEKEDIEMTRAMREKTQKGSAVGTEAFIEQLEQNIGYSIKDKKPRRPKTNK